jgi:NitT/TauT family transport system permease protein
MDLLLIGLATLATVLRILALIGVSIVSGWVLAYLCIKHRSFENVYIPIVNAFESIPVIAFLPIVLVVFISSIGGSLGVEIAADFLVFDAVSWNIWIGTYQAFKTVPGSLVEVAHNYKFSTWEKLGKLYIPHSFPRITSNLFSSFADALFYISVSEVFIVGVTTYHTFGIGTLIAQYLQQSATTSVLYCLLSIAVAVIAMTIIFSKLSRIAISKYGLNTNMAINHKKYMNYKLRRMVREGVIARLASKFRRHPSKVVEKESKGLSGSVLKYGTYLIFILIAMYLIYGSYRLVASVPMSQWNALFSETPSMLYGMGVDYVRVLLITLVSLAFAITVGYFLASRPKTNVIVTPIMQVFAAFPAPTYFPLLFIATLPILSAFLPVCYSEIYIFALGFLACFYYVFFDFWVGVQAIPSEFWEVMKNYEMSFSQKMRKIILPASFPYLITGISSTINSAWAGLAIGEYWPNIFGSHSLETKVGMMRFISVNIASGNITAAAYVSLIFAIVVIIYSFVFTRNMMDLARKKYVVEEGIYAA